MKAPTDPVSVHVCPWCEVQYLGIATAAHCGTNRCTAIAEWTPERWDGQRRMAEARQAADRDVLDQEAMTR
jgi:hypothetical protein